MKINSNISQATEKSSVVSLAKKRSFAEEKLEAHIQQLEDEINRLRSANEELSERLRSEVDKARGNREKFMCHLSQFLTNLYGELGKVQNNILKQSVGLNEYISKFAEENNSRMVMALEAKTRQLIHEGEDDD